MQLSEDDKKQVLAWLNSKCGAIRCTCCGIGNWMLSDHSNILLGVDVHTTRFFYHSGLPAVALICANCGHLELFSTAVIGFKPDQPTIIEIQEGLASAAQGSPPIIQK